MMQSSPSRPCHFRHNSGPIPEQCGLRIATISRELCPAVGDVPSPPFSESERNSRFCHLADMTRWWNDVPCGTMDEVSSYVRLDLPSFSARSSGVPFLQFCA